MDCILNTLFRKKSFLEEQSLKTPLRRCLGTVHLTFLSIAHVCGAGLYVMTGSVIRDDAGPATTISYLIGAISAAFTALCYAELATLIPKAGSCYTYTYIFIGEFPAFFIGWLLVSDYVMGMASVAKAFSGTINALSQDAIVNFTKTRVVEFHNEFLDKSLDLVAFAFVLVLMAITMSGAKSSLTFNGVVTLIQLTILLSITVASFVLGHVSNWSSDNGYFPYGFAGVVKGAGITVFAFSGFDVLANASEEAKDPKRSIPRALFISLCFITFVYVFATMGLTFLVPWRLVDYSAPYVKAFDYVNQPVLKWFGATATLLATGAAKISAMYTVPRMFYAMASDGLLFEWLAWVWSLTHVPLLALLVGGLLVGFLAMFFSIRVLSELTTFGILISYFAIGVNLMLLKYNPKYLVQTPQDASSPLEETVENDCGLSPDNGDHNQISQLETVEVASPVDLSPQLRFFHKHSLLSHMKSMTFFHILLVCHIVFLLLLSFITNVLHDQVTYGLLGLFIFCALVTFLLLCCYTPHTFAKDSFQTPLMPLTPCVTMLINGLLLVKLPGNTWIRGFIWLGIGFLIYFLYGIFHSRLRRRPSAEVNLLSKKNSATTND